MLLIPLTDVCCGSDPPKSYGPSQPIGNNYQNNYDSTEFQRPLAVFTEKPINVADFVLIPVVQVPSSDLRMIYRPQIDGVSKTEPIVMCKSSAKSSFVSTEYYIYIYYFQFLSYYNIQIIKLKYCDFFNTINYYLSYYDKLDHKSVM